MASYATLFANALQIIPFSFAICQHVTECSLGRRLKPASLLFSNKIDGSEFHIVASLEERCSRGRLTDSVFRSASRWLPMTAPFHVEEFSS